MIALQLLPPPCPSPTAARFQWKSPPTRVRIFAVASSSSKVDWVEATDAQFFQTDTRPIMLFDGVCNLCNGGVRFVRANDPNRRIRYESLQSESGRKLLQRSGRSPDDISSVVLVEKDRYYLSANLNTGSYWCLSIKTKGLEVKNRDRPISCGLVPDLIGTFSHEHFNNRSYIKSEAVLRIMEYLGLPFPQFALMLKLVPLFLRDFAYDNVANNRYEIFGRSETEACDIS